MMPLVVSVLLLHVVAGVQLKDFRGFPAINKFNDVANDLVTSVNDGHRELQVSDFDLFVVLVCEPWAQRLVDGGFSPSDFSCDCSSNNGEAPFQLSCTFNPICLSGSDLEQAYGETCPGEICTSISVGYEFGLNFAFELLQTDNNLTFTGDTGYKEIAIRSIPDLDTSEIFVVFENGQTFECREGSENCDPLANGDVPISFDCSNIQPGAVATCSLSFFDDFSVCPEGGAVAPIVFVPCFSGASTVMVRDKGPTEMTDLRLGDWVQVTGDDKYEPIYSFGHKNTEARADYLDISTTGTDRRKSPALEISKNHMLKLAKGGFVPAGALQVGDRLVSSDGTDAVVQSIETVQRQGIYAPFTESGTILVNGIVASTYVAYGESENLHVGNIDTYFTYQWLAHTFESLHRLAYKWNLVGEETYSESGVSHWVQGPHDFVSWLFQQHAVLVLPVVAVGIIVFGAISFVETAPAALLLGVLVFVNIMRPTISPAKKRN